MADILDPKVRELIRSWLLYAKQNSLLVPEDSDVKEFLVKNGYKEQDIDRLLTKITPVVPEINKPDETGTAVDSEAAPDKDEKDNIPDEDGRPRKLNDRERKLMDRIGKIIYRMTDVQTAFLRTELEKK
jgi:hypothetical protein